MDRDLVYDVGMHNGDDTAFYVSQGYRVVAIEADPAQAEAQRKRFAAEIEKGQVHVVEAAIGPSHGQSSFWISSNPEFNSFDRQNAEMCNNTSHEIQVTCRPMNDILAEFGTPFYLKVDIETADHFCLEALDPNDLPQFVSFEKSRLEDLFFMHNLGYSRFKLIAQEDFRQLSYSPDQANKWSRNLRPLRSRVRRMLGRRAPENVAKKRSAYGSSGPFGDETDGPWRQMNEIAFTWLAFDLGHTGDPDPVWHDWFDVHCAR
ncbi:MAG: FkbM family methyltransferase [Mesorhizobium sp.]|uniref:FkbM family methyltransferase n=1 Tax=Mesorhizobium sp. TaxID=1871066 RepID=UPI000FE5D273|nr:FkbM family methyltransferase [Mesorhizobium sp.]RWC46365.1 MAG: FkbM family methyltransferase [Mesorhizobium sp.]RWD52856.1 MAG: FkbM family methyltransferase [Mesorhizobium sp.]RWE63396.1 MAG: FkbM family methyltransferase [Mesorhizobium sp.]RWF05463.1 MAG: FkbM family methyltransferase [Mesorhizobium sp.]RWF11259.1 MAG: FkbM family methyltransferase [Mesorhizobium sp.]